MKDFSLKKKRNNPRIKDNEINLSFQRIPYIIIGWLLLKSQKITSVNEDVEILELLCTVVRV
jgi:hypothetical protein